MANISSQNQNNICYDRLQSLQQNKINTNNHNNENNENNNNNDNINNSNNNNINNSINSNDNNNTNIMTSSNNNLNNTNHNIRRKFSFPITLHSSTILDVNTTTAARRRLSNVSDAVTRKLSYTIGWKGPQIPAQDIITQGKCLCGQYIKRRLRRSGLFNRKLGLQRIRSILGTASFSVVREVFPALMVLGDELERMHPRVYNGVARQISRQSGGELQTADTVAVLLNTVARDLFRSNITWGKIISLFAITGGLAVDCVRQGHPDYLPKLIEGFSDVIEDELVPWINDNGGWSGLNTHVYPISNELSIFEWTTLIISCIVALIIILFILRFILLYLIPFLYSKT